MVKTETAGAADFRANLTKHLVGAEHGSKTTIVTRNGRPAAALVPYSALEQMRDELQRCGYQNIVVDRQIEILERVTG